jgi:hypothetical protein
VAEDDFIRARYVGGSHDGGVNPLPLEFVREGYVHSVPSRRHYYAADDEPLKGTVPPDERYVLHETDDGWVFAHVP